MWFTVAGAYSSPWGRAGEMKGPVTILRSLVFLLQTESLEGF